jgi:hypothetical protein
MEPQSHYDVLSGRLEALERECRRWRRLGVAGLLAAVVAAVGGAAAVAPGEIELERLVIRNKDAKRAIVLSATDGDPSLTFTDEGQEKVAMSLAEDGTPMLSFLDAGNPRLMLGLSRNGVPVLNFNDENRHRRISLGIFPKVGPTFALLDETGAVISKSP